MNLKKCPPRIGYVGTQLVCLNLINNRLTELPEEIGLLRGLEELFLQYNCLEELPVRIGGIRLKLLETIAATGGLYPPQKTKTKLPQGLTYFCSHKEVKIKVIMSGYEIAQCS